jgi:hypothetical protein
MFWKTAQCAEKQEQKIPGHWSQCTVARLQYMALTEFTALASTEILFETQNTVNAKFTTLQWNTVSFV